MQGNYPSPSKPKTESVYLPADYADVVAGDITLPREGPAHPSLRERTIQVWYAGMLVYQYRYGMLQDVPNHRTRAE